MFCGLLMNDRRPRVHVLDVEHADHDRGDRVARDAEHERRDPCAGQRASCWPRPPRRCPRRGRCRTSPAPSRSACSSRTVIHAAMSAPAPGWMPIGGAERAAAQRSATDTSSSAPTCRWNTLPILSAANTTAAASAGRRGAGSPRPRTCRPSSGSATTPPSSSALPKVKRGMRARVVQADAGDQQARAAARPSPSACSTADEHRAGQTRARRARKYSNDAELESRPRPAPARRAISTAVPNRPPIAENTRPAPSADLGLALLGHRIGLVGVGGRGRRARDAQQRAGNVAARRSPSRCGDDRCHRGHRRHEERHRHQQRGGHRRR